MSSHARRIQRRILKKRKVSEVPLVSNRTEKVLGYVLPLYVGQVSRRNV